MHGITAPQSPEAFRRETAWIYSQGAPGVFKGDLYYYNVDHYYYNVDHDLTGLAATIDTTKTPLYILTGEYDRSSTPAMGRALAAEVPGATFQAMLGLGHFPMCEHPALFGFEPTPNIPGEKYARAQVLPADARRIRSSADASWRSRVHL